MAILFAGTSVADMEINSGSSLYTVTDRIGPNVVEGINCDNNGRYSKTPDFTPTTEVWVSEYLANAGTTSGTNNTVLLNGPLATPLVRIAFTGGKFLLQVYRSSAWVTLATSVLDVPTTIFRLDFRCKLSATVGEMELYINGALFVSYSGNTAPSSGTDIYSLSVGNITIGGTCVHSAIMVADENTRGLTFIQRLPAGNGALSQWTGSYTAIDETGINDADFITPSTAGDISTFTFQTIPSQYTDFDVKAVVLSGRGQAGPSDPTGFDMVTRVGSTNYFSALASIPPAFAGRQVVLLNNPATGVPWTRAEVDAAQFGFRAVA